MSLFENGEFQWRETFFVLFDQDQRPTGQQMRQAIEKLGDRLTVSEFRQDDKGRFESMTVLAPDDFSAMDVSCVSGDEVKEQVPELVKELRPNLDLPEDEEQLTLISGATARLDIFHFEQHSFSFDSDGAEEDFMDPGGLLIVLRQLAELCGGVVVDPQSASVL